MTWALSAVIALMQRLVAPLVRRGLRHLAMAAMGALVSLAALAAGYGLILISLWLPAAGLPLVIALGLLGWAIRLAGLMGLAAAVVTAPLIVAADCLAPGRRTPPEADHPTDTL